MSLHIPTLLIVMLVIAVLMLFWVGVMAVGFPARDTRWAAALSLAAYAIGTALLGFREWLPAQVSIPLGNAAYVAALSMMSLALKRYLGGNARWFFLLIPIGLAGLLMACLLEHYRWRVVVIGLILLIQTCSILRTLVGARTSWGGRGHFMLTAAFSTLAIALFFYVGLALCCGDIFATPQGEETSRAWIAVIAMCVVLSATLGFVHMDMERNERLGFDLAMKDELTGLPNRRAVTQCLFTAAAHARRHSSTLGLLMVDIDHFKQINDAHGHQAGDAVLTAVALQLQKRLRAEDQVGRTGGEEFLIIMTDTSMAGAMNLAESLRLAIEALIVHWGPAKLAVTISIGLMARPVTEADTVEALIAIADAAMYRAKRGGRNRVECAASDPC